MIEEKRKQERKPAAAPDRGEVSDSDLEKVSGGTATTPSTADATLNGDSRVGAPGPKPQPF